MTNFGLKCSLPKYASENRMWPQILTVSIVSLVGFSAGIHFGWPSPSVPKLLSKDFPITVTSENALYITTSAFLAQIVGNIASSLLIDTVGRNPTLLLTAPLFLISLLLIYFSSRSIVFLYVARVVGGIAEGSIYIVCPLYISEISEPRIRGVLISLSKMFFCCGIPFINLVGFYYSIPTASLLSMPFIIIFPLLFLFAFESPYFLLMKKQTERAYNSLKKLRWSENVEEELTLLQRHVARQMSENTHLQDLVLIKSNRKALIILSVIGIVSVFSGLPTLTIFAQSFYFKAMPNMPQQWVVVLTQLLKLVPLFVAVVIVDMLGRRILLLISTSGCCIGLTSLSIFFFLRDYTSLDVDKFNWVCLVAIILADVSSTFGFDIAETCLVGELFPAGVKAKAVCVITVLKALFTFASTVFYQVLSDNYGIGVPLGVYAVVELLGFFFCWRWLPETKRKSLEEIQQDLKSMDRAL